MRAAANRPIEARPHYRIVRFQAGWGIVVHRDGRPPEFIDCGTLGEANRMRRRFDDSGLPGLIVGGG